MGRNNILKMGGKNLDIENWIVYHPDGTHMFTCGKKKAKWYLDRDLAIQVNNNEIQLTFQPKGHGFSENEEFGKSIREARCVITGIKEDLQRHHIVPYCYRSYFSEEYKSKNHHDVVLINHDIHAEYEIEATKYKNELAHIYGVKKINDYNKAYIKLINQENRDKLNIMNKVSAIINGHNKIPMEIIKKNLHDVSEYLNLDYNLLIKCNYIQLLKLYRILKKQYEYQLQVFQQKHKKYYDHGYHLVKKLNTEDKLRDFVILWRKHFIETMNPQYMPDGWSIKFRVKTNL